MRIVHVWGDLRAERTGSIEEIGVSGDEEQRRLQAARQGKAPCP
jgi:hypothetical protein